ncbi:TPA: (2Fe-2S)-binding protein [Pseudomonas aeruginosa]
MPTSLVLNGKNVTLDVDPNMPLLWAIRESAGLHGTKFGCGMAQCGACTVQLDGTAVRSCVLPVSAVAGKCGYCQSGQIMSATALLEQNASPSDADIDAAMNGNICRCAAYVRIRAAIHEAADTLKA